MQHTCGILFYKENKILIGHGKGQLYWDLPKGKAEDGETFAEAAARECKEETGVVVNPDDLTFLGNVQYVKGKRLVLYSYTHNAELIEMYQSEVINNRKEFTSFKYIDMDDCNQYLTPRMCKSISEAIKIYKDNI